MCLGVDRRKVFGSLGLEIVFKFPGIKKSKDVEYSAFGALAHSCGLSSPLASISNLFSAPDAQGPLLELPRLSGKFHHAPSVTFLM
jgi:hypothetical protein